MLVILSLASLFTISYGVDGIQAWHLDSVEVRSYPLLSISACAFLPPLAGEFVRTCGNGTVDGAIPPRNLIQGEKTPEHQRARPMLV
jgi:hypothetical protein